MSTTGAARTPHVVAFPLELPVRRTPAARLERVLAIGRRLTVSGLIAIYVDRRPARLAELTYAASSATRSTA